MFSKASKPFRGVDHMPTADSLPEGTDTIIAGAAESDRGGAGEAQQSTAERLRSQAASKVAELRDQTTDRFFAFAAQGKDRASETLDGAAKLIGDAAAQVETHLGGTYGAYARQAADGVAGLATALRTREVDELFEEARGFVKRSPALAIGAAAAAGFLVARLLKAGGTTLEEASQSVSAAARARGEGSEDGDSKSA